MDFRKVTPDSINYIKKASTADQARLYVKLTKLHRIAAQNVWFNQQCKQLHVIPNYIQIRSSTNSRAASIAISKAQNIWLNEECRRWFSNRDNLKIHLKVLYSELSYKLHNIEFDILDGKARELASMAVYEKYQIQSRKLQRLVSSSSRNRNNDIHTEYHQFYPRVKNLSDVQFPTDELTLLNKGLKYNLTPSVSQKSLETMAVDAEVAVVIGRKDNIVKSLVANEIRAVPAFSHFNPEFPVFKSLKQRIRENDLIVTKADKGNTVVIMESSGYSQKVNDVIQGDDFELLESDPTKKFTSDIKLCIQQSSYVFPDHNLSRSNLVPMNPQAPILYGLPKIHKEHVPIRPVVSYIGAPAYFLAKKLNSLLREKSGFNPTYSLKNGLDLISKIKDIHIPPKSILLSLDVDSLFTNVPSPDCLRILADLFEKRRLHPGETNDLLNLTSLCMKQNYFRFNNRFYLQKEGLAMGSPLSPLMADIFMDNFEKQHIVVNQNILYYYRYVDDIIICWTGTRRQLDVFLNKINRVHDKIKFKLELEQDCSLNFLDLTITRKESSHVFQIYRKPTHTDTVIPASSCHPWQHKVAAFYCYINRLFTVPLSKENYLKELNIIYQIAVSNGFSKNLINNLIKKKQKHVIRNSLYAVQPQSVHRYVSSLTYLGPISEKVANTLRQNGVYVAFKTNNSLRNICNSKDKLDIRQKSGVYKLVCDECHAVYVGQTGRNFETRYKEHLAAYRNCNPDKSHFAKHLLDTGHNLANDHSFKVLHTCNKGLRLCVLEQLEILKSNNNTVALLNEQTNVTNSPLLNIFKPAL
ncbi:unnamed protein product [Parnassius mnemosyne]|uniref:Reverse transcriptase domain-containing protein n=1 Tax=Parnassius mnemosyne TaxID=213953 RepID=A0AAV1LP28_9NEOP